MMEGFVLVSVAKRQCTRMALRPLKDVGNLRERYTEDTADVIFVENETKERLLAHREVLKVASPIFFEMFSGDWKEKEEKEIPAPEEYNWESFKAAITLLYGEEVEVEESSILDIYRVAHLYDFREVISVLAHEVCQWDSDLLETVVDLCVLAQDMPDGKENVLKSAIQHIACHMKQSSSSIITRLSFESMQLLVQSEDITSTELVLLRILNHWTNAQSDISLKHTKQLYSHIRFGTIPYKDLAECSVIGHDNLKSALENHQELSRDRVRNNLVQITPRSGQKEVFQVYPMAQGVRAVVKSRDLIEVANVSESPAVGVVYWGKQQITFQVDLKMEKTSMYNYCDCQLYDLKNCYSHSESQKMQTTHTEECPHEHVTQARSRWAMGLANQVTINFDFLHWTVVLDPKGAHITLKSTDLEGDACATVNMDLRAPGSFPWLLTFGVRCSSGNGRILLLTIHPPTL